MIFLERPVSATLLAIMAFSLFWPFIRDWREKRKKEKGIETELDRVMKQGEAFDVKDD